MAVPSYGAVLHTLNIRLFPEQVVYIVNHAEDGVVFVDGSLVEPLAELAPQLPGVRQYVVMGDGDLDALPGRRLLRAAARGGRRGRVRVARDRRARRGGALLHERHHRQPEGRALLAPLGVAALDDDLHGRRRRALVARPRAGHRADVPRQRVGPALRRGAHRRRAAAARPVPAGRAAGALRARPSARRCWPACRPCSGRCSPTSTSTAATSARCAAGSAAARPCRARSWRASSATACASCRRGG